MITAACVTLIFILFIIKCIRLFEQGEKENVRELYEIPCPGGLPLIGNLTEIFKNKDDFWNTSRKRALDYYPMYRLKMLNRNIVFLLNPEDVKIILSGTEGRIKGPYYDSFRKLSQNGLVVNNGESWKSRRKLLTKHFHFASLKNYVDMFNREINHMVNGVQKNINQCVDVAYHVQNMTFKIINETIFGNISAIKSKESRQYLESMATVTEVSLLKVLKPHLNLVWPLMKLKKVEDEALSKMRGYVLKAIEESSCEKFQQGNMLALLRSSPTLFDSTSIRHEIDTFIFAGQDTTSTALSFMLMVLANYPNHQERLYQEIRNTLGEKRAPTCVDFSSMEFLDRFIKECLRLYPPFIMSERLLTKEMVTATGYRLPSGTIVFVPIFDIHRNPKLYPEPEIFNPDRFLMENIVERHPFSYIPFSAGPRNCIAQKYALLTIKASICRILQNFEIEPVTIIHNIEFSLDAMLQIKGGIQVKFKERSLINC